jgi:L-iditol 2-dehydrogenase
MKALRLHGPGDLRLADEPAPTPGPGEVLVRVTAVGICGSDLHWYDESAIGDAVLTRPLVLGHEAAGVIVDGPRAGQRVALDPQVPCGACDTCAAGRGHLCPRVRFLGHSVTDGAMRELLAWPAANLVPLPDGIDDAAGAMLEPLGVGIHALRLARVRPGDSVGVFGCGPIGLLLIQLARAAGATTIVATDRLPHRVAAARRLGAIAALVDGGRERDILLDATGGRGIDAAIEIAGEDDAIDRDGDRAGPTGRHRGRGRDPGRRQLVDPRVFRAAQGTRSSVLAADEPDLSAGDRPGPGRPDRRLLAGHASVRPGRVRRRLPNRRTARRPEGDRVADRSRRHRVTP